MVEGPKPTSDRPASSARPPGRFDWMLVFPVAAAVAWGWGQDAVAMVLVAVLPAWMALDGRLLRRDGAGSPAPAAAAVAQGRASIQRMIEDVLEDCARRDRTTAVLQVRIDDLDVADGEWDDGAEMQVMDRVVQRIGATMRGQDVVIRASEESVALVLAPTRRADLDVVMAIVDRLQAAISEPISVDGRSVRVRSCIGLCTEAMAPARTGAAMLAASDCALRIARRQGGDAVRAFNADMRERVETDHRLAVQIEDALSGERIRAWFQPQVDARSGTLVGFEALARWDHPELGLLLPDRFLGPVAAAGRSAELGERMLAASLDALLAWDRAGLAVPRVGVNVSLEQLCDPRLADRIAWQLDRHDIEPARIAIEILETVTLRDGDETVMRNLRALREAGFRLDLDDFGTGAASIAHIARFGVHRIKIDRSFVQGIDRDPGRREIVAAILALADRLGIETLAEGVETAEERAVLAEMGCPHLQGFAIARPMPFAETLEWGGCGPVGGRTPLERMVPLGTA